MEVVGDVAAIDLGGSLRALRRRWWLVALATLLGGAVGAALFAGADDVWEAEATVEVGTILGKPLEDANALARFVASDSFLAVLGPQPGDDLRALALPGETPAAPPQVRIRVQSRDAAEARRLAADAVAALERRYANGSAAALRELDAYHEALQRTATQLGESIAQMEATLARLDLGARDQALTLLALQSQLEARRAEHLRLVREIKDAALQRALTTHPTRQVGDVAVTGSPTWPQPLAFVVIGAMLGLLAGAAVAAAAPGPRHAA